jgi:hypothetical protein
MKKEVKKVTDNTWVSLSDIMTSLMIIFLFIAVSYMVEVKRRDSKIDDVLKVYSDTKEDLANEIRAKLGENFKHWEVEFDEEDLSIKFTNPDILFASGSANINHYFSNILDNFLPNYFSILLQDKYKGKIAEIRIEGHTDDVGFGGKQDSYIENVRLSQSRSASVMNFFRNTNYFKSLPTEKQKELEFLLTANGLSYGRALDANKNFAFISSKSVDRRISRRVEFKIVPATEILLKKISELKKD